MNKMLRKHLPKLITMILVFVFIVPLHGAAAESHIDRMKSDIDVTLTQSSDLYGTMAKGTLHVCENYAIATIQYYRPGTLRVNLLIQTGLGDERWEKTAIGGNTIGGDSCTAGTQDKISSKTLYARADYYVKSTDPNGTGTKSWEDYNQWGKKEVIPDPDNALIDCSGIR